MPRVCGGVGAGHWVHSVPKSSGKMFSLDKKDQNEKVVFPEAGEDMERRRKVQKEQVEPPR